MKKIVLLLVVVCFSLSGCEKDDICDAATATTPRLVVEFYSVATPTVSTAVTKLRVQANGVAEPITYNASLPTTDPARYLSNDKKIYLPLQTTANSTTYKLTFNSGVAGSENTDYLTINYDHHEVYVSRACGFKSLFDLVGTTPLVLTDNTPTDGLWIQNSTIVKTNIESEYDVHVKIYF